MHKQDKRVTAKQLAAIISSEMEDTALAWKIADILKAFDGKQITKRIATAIEKGLPGYNVRYDNSITMYHVEIYESGKGFRHEDRTLRLMLGHHTSGSFDHARFISNHAACSLGAADARNARRAEQIADVDTLRKVAKAINAHNKALKQIHTALDYPFEGRWTIYRDCMAGPVGKEGYL